MSIGILISTSFGMFAKGLSLTFSFIVLNWSTKMVKAENKANKTMVVKKFFLSGPFIINKL
jgi:hypothetical protein